MTKELIKNLKPGVKIKIKGKVFTILQHIIWLQTKRNETYDKYVLQDARGNNKIRLFIAGDFIGFSHVFKYDFKEPMPKMLEFKRKKYKLTQDEFCVVKKTEGKKFYKVGDCEIWWDYSAIDTDGTGFSLGRNWQTWEREDLKTEKISLLEIKIIKPSKQLHGQS